MRLITSDKDLDSPRWNFASAFSPSPFFMAGVQDGFSSLSIVTIVFLLTLLLSWRRGKGEWICSAGSFLIALGMGLFLIKMNFWESTLDTRCYYMINQLTYFLLAIWAFIRGLAHFRDWWEVRETEDGPKIDQKLPNAWKTPVGKSRPSILYSGLFSLIVGFYFSLMQSVYPSPAYLGAMINTMFLESMQDQISFFLLIYVAMLILSMGLIILLVGVGIFTPEVKAFVRSHLSVFEIAASGIYLSIGIGLLYLLNQPFLGG